MKRWAVRVFAALILLVVALAAVSIRPLDREAPQEKPYFAKTLRALQAELETSRPCQDGLLEAGVGRAGLTPAVGTPLAGYGARKGRPSTGVHDSLYARALALRVGDCRVIFLALEALIVPSEVAQRVLDSLAADPGLAPRSVYLGATHTHSGTGGWGRGPLQEAFAGPFTPAVVEMLVDSSVAAARRAWEDLAPAEIAWAQFDASRYTANRLVGRKGTIDSLFSFVALRRDGRLLAVLGSFAAHATTLPASNFEFSGDWPGVWSQSIEANGVAGALFLAGGVGSHSPRGPGRGFDKAEAIGRALADSVLRRLPGLEWRKRVVLRSLSFPLFLGSMQFRLSQNLRLAPWLARRMTRPGPAWINAVRIGDFVWLSAPADWSGELTRELRKMAGKLGLRTTVTSFNGGYIGYVVPDRYYSLDEYETRLMSFYGPHTASYLMEIYRRVLHGIAGVRIEERTD